ncbi:MAG: hypothetical protein AABN95_25345 [Acidobacteriota bacterium]
MQKINWARLFSGGLVAAVICFLSDGFLHERLVAAEWKSVYDNLRVPNPPEEHIGALFYFAIFEIGRGFLSLFLYALMRPLFRPGPKTAALAGLVAWFAFSLTATAQFIPLGFYSQALWMKVGGFQLVTSIVAAVAGAALYKDGSLPESDLKS